MEPVTVELVYDERWIRNKIDPVELVTLWESGLSCEAIARRFGVSRTGVWRHLQKRAKHGSVGK